MCQSKIASQPYLNLKTQNWLTNIDQPIISVSVVVVIVNLDNKRCSNDLLQNYQ